MLWRVKYASGFTFGGTWAHECPGCSASLGDREIGFGCVTHNV